METDFYAAMLVPPFHPSPEWAESLAENLLSPSFPISIWEAFGRRLRRNYIWIFLILYAAWLAKIWLFPEPAADLAAFIQRSSFGPLSGELMIGLGFGFYASLFAVALATISMNRATGEVLPRFGEEGVGSSLLGQDQQRKGLHAFMAPRHRRRQLMALIITDKAEAVAMRILSDLRRGVTAVSGKGMYTGQERSVLICALTVTEVHNLKAAVNKEDPNAFVVVSAAQEILGRGFNPLTEE
jgi:hypothetical protein